MMLLHPLHNGDGVMCYLPCQTPDLADGKLRSKIATNYSITALDARVDPAWLRWWCQGQSCRSDGIKLKQRGEEEEEEEQADCKIFIERRTEQN